MDVFLALHRRTDQVARELAEIWPPRPRVDGKWKKEREGVRALGLKFCCFFMQELGFHNSMFPFCLYSRCDTE